MGARHRGQHELKHRSRANSPPRSRQPQPGRLPEWCAHSTASEKSSLSAAAAASVPRWVSSAHGQRAHVRAASAAPRWELDSSVPWWIAKDSSHPHPTVAATATANARGIPAVSSSPDSSINPSSSFPNWSAHIYTQPRFPVRAASASWSTAMRNPPRTDISRRLPVASAELDSFVGIARCSARHVALHCPGRGN